MTVMSPTATSVMRSILGFFRQMSSYGDLDGWCALLAAHTMVDRILAECFAAKSQSFAPNDGVEIIMAAMSFWMVWTVRSMFFSGISGGDAIVSIPISASAA